MNRWTWGRIVTAAFVAAAAGLSLPLPATAQTMQRTVPADVRLAKMVVVRPPEILLNGVADRLSPGARIRDTNNFVQLSGSLVNAELPVVYKRDVSGLVHEVWILSANEYAQVARLPGAEVGPALVIIWNKKQ